MCGYLITLCALNERIDKPEIIFQIVLYANIVIDNDNNKFNCDFLAGNVVWIDF